MPTLGTYITFGVSFGVLVWLFVSTSYRLTDTELQAQCGPTRVRVPLHAIERIRRSNSLISAPALSFKRLEVSYAHGKSVLISPDDEQRFFAALKKRAPQAELLTEELT